MKPQQAIITLLGALPLASAAETVVGVYMFHRHGDRTPKVFPPANLTDLGYREVYQSGKYYHDRYIADGSSRQIYGISSELVNLVQIAASAPLDPVLQNSAEGFLQALYPAVGDSLATQTLADGDTATAPLHGYQLIPVNIVESGAGSESSGWLQDATACYKAEISSNDYFYSPQYNKLESSTAGFYKNLLPVIEPTFNSSTATYKNAYTIYDLINVATIHNASIPHGTKLTPSVLKELLELANIHEYNLAYNSSSTIRAIAGKQLAAEIVDFLATNVETKGATSKFGVQFGSYGTFFSFFGLAQLPAASTRFTGIAQYASAMSFELFTRKSFTDFPKTSDLLVRFFYHNGTTSTASPPVQYPLFGQNKLELSWSEFQDQMGKFSVGTTAEWCHACGNSTGTCAPYAKIGGAGSSSSGSAAGSDSSSSCGGMSNAVAGVIGAFVTLGVILLIEGAILLFGGFTLVKKNRMAAGRAVANGAHSNGKA